MIEQRWKVADRNNPPKGAVNVDVGDHFEYCVLQYRQDLANAKMGHLKY